MDHKERAKFIKKIIFWSVLAGGLIALFIPLLGAGNIDVLAQCSGGSFDACEANCGGNSACINQCSIGCRDNNSGSTAPESIDVCSIGPCIQGIEGVEGEGGIAGVANIVTNVLNVFIYMGFAVGVAALVYGGYQWSVLSVTGDSQASAKGSKTVYYAIVALAALGGVYLILSLTATLINALNGAVGDGGGTGDNGGQSFTFPQSQCGEVEIYCRARCGNENPDCFQSCQSAASSQCP